MSDEPTKCPVCAEEFGNPGACATHMQRTKDAAHTANRAGAPPPASPPDAAASHDAAPASHQDAKRIASPDAPASVGASSDASDATRRGDSPDAMRSDAMHAQASTLSFFEQLGAGLPPTAQPVEEVKMLSLPPPTTVEPLMPASGDAARGDARPVSPVSVPLEPILAGTVCMSINALVLNKPGDGKLTPEKVAQTGFPKAVEASLRLYFPELPLDHPLTALIASGASLGLMVVELKAKAPSDAPTQATPQATVQAPAQAPPHAVQAGASTGDAYWDAILRSQAGGVA